MRLWATVLGFCAAVIGAGCVPPTAPPTTTTTTTTTSTTTTSTTTTSTTTTSTTTTSTTTTSTTTTSTIPDDPWQAAEGECWDSTLSYPFSLPLGDIRYEGPVNTLYNASRFSSSDGTCTGADGFKPTVVQAASSLEAYFICQSLGAVVDTDLFGLNPKQATPPEFTSSLSDAHIC